MSHLNDFWISKKRFSKLTGFPYSKLNKLEKKGILTKPRKIGGRLFYQRIRLGMAGLHDDQNISSVVFYIKEKEISLNLVENLTKRRKRSLRPKGEAYKKQLREFKRGKIDIAGLSMVTRLSQHLLYKYCKEGIFGNSLKRFERSRKQYIEKDFFDSKLDPKIDYLGITKEREEQFRALQSIFDTGGKLPKTYFIKLSDLCKYTKKPRTLRYLSKSGQLGIYYKYKNQIYFFKEDLIDIMRTKNKNEYLSNLFLKFYKEK